ncbi:MAG: hypothetical protein J1E79_07690, partial [Rikenella sp.]|nr:hypothetical protein [Rikenella sp.]
ARRENPVQKQFMLLNDFPHYPRRAVPLGTRNGQPIPLQAYTRQEETALGPGRPRVPAEGYGLPLPQTNAEGERCCASLIQAEAPKTLDKPR